MRMRRYVCKRARLLEQMEGFKRVSSGVCKRKGHELPAAAGGIPQEGGKLKSVTSGRRWSWMSLGKRRACR